MWRIRLHGRGGQGIKTAGRILGSAFFAEGFEVQDAPRYGAERRGAPLDASVRAGRRPIRERGTIRAPDLVVIGDETLLPVPGVLAGVDARCAVLVRSVEAETVWRARLPQAREVLVLPPAGGERAELAAIGAACAGAAARLIGVLRLEALEAALHEELGALGPPALAESLSRARAAWHALAAHAGCVPEGPDAAPAPGAPDWIELPFEPAPLSAPDIRGAATSLQVHTGLWRTQRPVVDLELCHRCSWICGTFCPEGAITPGPDRAPVIDYDHCKGCLVCVAVCPPHAIRAEPEAPARAAAGAER
jgi:pyruvate ferredoxin oxidoreductase gamma subunit